MRSWPIFRFFILLLFPFHHFSPSRSRFRTMKKFQEKRRKEHKKMKLRFTARIVVHELLWFFCIVNFEQERLKIVAVNSMHRCHLFVIIIVGA